MFIGKLDTKITEMKHKRIERRERSLSFQQSVSPTETTFPLKDDSQSSEANQSTSDDSDFKASIKTERNYTPIPNVVKVCDRYNVSNTVPPQ